MTIGNPAFCLLNLTGVHFWGKLQHGGDVSQQKTKCRPIRTQEIGGFSLSDVLSEIVGVSLSDVLYGNVNKVTAARTKMEVGKLRTRVAQCWGQSHQNNWGRMYGRPILISELVYQISNIQYMCFHSMLELCTCNIETSLLKYKLEGVAVFFFPQRYK